MKLVVAELTVVLLSALTRAAEDGVFVRFQLDAPTSVTWTGATRPRVAPHHPAVARHRA